MTSFLSGGGYFPAGAFLMKMSVLATAFVLGSTMLSSLKTSCSARAGPQNLSPSRSLLSFLGFLGVPSNVTVPEIEDPPSWAAATEAPAARAIAHRTDANLLITAFP